MSVSVPFLVKSLHAGATQVPPEQTRLWQSEDKEQLLPVPQPGHDPPQSVPVSFPFLMASVHVAGWHVPLAHRRL